MNKTTVIVKLPSCFASGRREAWYKTVNSVSATEKGAKAFGGEYLKHSVEHRLTVGALLLMVAPTGSASEGVNCASLWRVLDDGTIARVTPEFHWRKEFESLRDATFEILAMDAKETAPEADKGVVDVLADLTALARKVARLNPDAGEIGAGMLAQLIAEAKRALGE